MRAKRHVFFVAYGTGSSLSLVLISLRGKGKRGGGGGIMFWSIRLRIGKKVSGDKDRSLGRREEFGRGRARVISLHQCACC